MKEIVSFYLSGKIYGVEVSHMNGIEIYSDYIPVNESKMPSFLGFVDIRGDKIPLVNIRHYLILPQVPVTDNTKYLVFRTEQGPLACIADGVAGIFRAEGENVQDFPFIMQNKKTGYADFIARKGEDLVIVISPDRLLSKNDWRLIHSIIKKMEDEERAERERQLEAERKKMEEEARAREAAADEAAQGASGGQDD